MKVNASIVVIAASAAIVAVLAGCSSSEGTQQQGGRQRLRLSARSETELGREQGRYAAASIRPAAVQCLTEHAPLTFAVDSKSVSVGDDGVVRYMVVATSPSGARNVNYEGIRYDTYEWRRYASINEDGTGWDRAVAFDFRRIENGELNAYRIIRRRSIRITSARASCRSARRR